MTNKNSQEQLVNLAMRELTRVFEDLKAGKTPEISPIMEKLATELESVQDKKSMSEEEVNNFASKLVEEMSKIKS